MGKIIPPASLDGLVMDMFEVAKQKSPMPQTFVIDFQMQAPQRLSEWFRTHINLPEYRCDVSNTVMRPLRDDNGDAVSRLSFNWTSGAEIIVVYEVVTLHFSFRFIANYEYYAEGDDEGNFEPDWYVSHFDEEIECTKKQINSWMVMAKLALEKSDAA
ncbi:hypothetical protein [Escherichia coli]|uniref:hypothetical protein n=1 Tax=Escherichia coli TaxID=562 RepID=UPI000E216CD2|nr:hypothetical protein [Escherichia coli]